MTKLNRAQQATYNRILDCVLYGDREVKSAKFEGNEYNKDVYVQLETGRANDEGTTAEVLLRDCYCFSIGARGGIYHFAANGTREYIQNYEVMTKTNIW